MSASLSALCESSSGSDCNHDDKKSQADSIDKNHEEGSPVNEFQRRHSCLKPHNVTYNLTVKNLDQLANMGDKSSDESSSDSNISSCSEGDNESPATNKNIEQSNLNKSQKSEDKSPLGKTLLSSMIEKTKKDQSPTVLDKNELIKQTNAVNKDAQFSQEDVLKKLRATLKNKFVQSK